MSNVSNYMASVPVPPMPPHGSADPNAPDYNPERAAWIDANPGGTAAWQKWIQGREHAIDQDLIGGAGLDPTYQAARGSDSKEAGRPDQLVLDYINERYDKYAQSGLKDSIAGNYAHFDPQSGLYFQYLNGQLVFRDSSGHQVTPPAGAEARARSIDPGKGTVHPLATSMNPGLTAAPGTTPTDPGANPQTYSGPLLTRPTTELGWTANPSAGDWEALQKTNPTAIAPESASMFPQAQSREKSPSPIGDVAASPFGYQGNTFGYNAPGGNSVSDSSSQATTGQRQTSQQLQPGEAGWQAKPFVPGMGQDPSQTDQLKKQQQLNSAGIQY